LMLSSLSPLGQAKWSHYLQFGLKEKSTHTLLPLFNMIVYYDIVADKEIASDAFEQKAVDGYKGVREIQSKKIVVKEVEADIGANASVEGGDDDEGVDEAEEETVLNVVHSANLQKIELSQKEFTSMQKAYWKKLIEQVNKERYKALGIRVSEDDDKDSIKEKEAAAMEELSKFELAAVEQAKERMAKFKANFTDLQNFIKEVVIKNFNEFEFYICEEGELGECMIIPARYIGEAECPIFYMYDDGIRFKKE